MIHNHCDFGPRPTVHRTLPRLLIKELIVIFDGTADVSTVPFAGSLEAF